MKGTVQTAILVIWLLCAGVAVNAQTKYKVHSHNDYAQELPFWYAYSNGAESIEADLFLQNDTLYVTHAQNEIEEGKTFEKLYLYKLSSLEKSDELAAKMAMACMIINSFHFTFSCNWHHVWSHGS